MALGQDPLIPHTLYSRVATHVSVASSSAAAPAEPASRRGLREWANSILA